MLTITTPQGTSWAVDTTNLRATGKNDNNHLVIVRNFQDATEMQDFVYAMQFGKDTNVPCIHIL